MKLLGSSAGATPDAKVAARAMGLPSELVFRSNAADLGLLPAGLSGEVAHVYGLLSGAGGMLQLIDRLDREPLLSQLLRLTDAAAALLRSLEGYLDLVSEAPQGQEAGRADLPVRNTRPRVRVTHILAADRC